MSFPPLKTVKCRTLIFRRRRYFSPEIARREFPPVHMLTIHQAAVAATEATGVHSPPLADLVSTVDLV